MKDRILYAEIIEAIIVTVLGTLFHFVYQLSGNNFLAGLFTPVNESIWEHLKLLFFPSLILFVIEMLFLHDGCLIPAKALGILCGMAAIVVLFYTYTGIIGTNFLALDILTFIIGVAVSSYVTYQCSQKSFCHETKWKIAGAAIFIVFAILFFIFTVNPPKIALFLDPITNSFGIQPV